MKNILEAPFLVEMVCTTTNMYNYGWDERNGGNISLLLSEADVAEYVDVNTPIRTILTGFEAPALEDKYFLSLARANISRTCSTIRPATWGW